MGLTRPKAESHIAQWTSRLSGGNWPYRQHWPSRLFRHEPIENAVSILKSGELLSRDHSVGCRVRDIAPPEIVNNRTAAHAFVRLYFRPKSPTQYRIEGIAKPAEYYRGKHAPVLVMMVFEAKQLLCHAGVNFSDGNMQDGGTSSGDSPEFFDAIRFDRVFHDGAFDPQSEEGQEIIRCRCAEVLVPSPHVLNGSLQSVLCRSAAERSAMLYLLGHHAGRWEQRIRVVTESGVFQNRYTYVDTVDLSDAGLAFTLHPRRDGASVVTRTEIRDEQGKVVATTGPEELDPAKRWIVRKPLSPGNYLVTIDLENCRAYEGISIVDDLPF